MTLCVDVLCGSQGVEGASAAAHALSLPAEAYGNDVSEHLYILSDSHAYTEARMLAAVKWKEMCSLHVL